MKLPLESILKKGLVLVLKITFPNGNKKDKFVVVLNKEHFDDIILCVLPTASHIHDYKTKYKFKNHFILPKGKSKYFNKKNVFDFENIQEFSYKNFKNIYKKEFVDYKGILEKEIIEKIDKHIRKSKTIIKYWKQLILGSRNLGRDGFEPP